MSDDVKTAERAETDASHLFSPIKMGQVSLMHRVVHAPRTRLPAGLPAHHRTARKGRRDDQRNPGPGGFGDAPQVHKGTIISAGGFDRTEAEAILARGDTDMVAFGHFFTSNPDLPERLRRNLPLTLYERDAFWGGDEHWYTDFKPYQAMVTV